MSFKIGRSKRSVLAYSILAISVIAAISSVGAAFAQTTTSTSTTASSTGSQTGTGPQPNSSASGVNCPNMGNPGNATATTTGAPAAAFSN